MPACPVGVLRLALAACAVWLRACSGDSAGVDFEPAAPTDRPPAPSLEASLLRFWQRRRGAAADGKATATAASASAAAQGGWPALPTASESQWQVLLAFSYWLSSDAGPGAAEGRVRVFVCVWGPSVCRR